VICLLTTAGPWGVFSVSSASQQQRLLKFLTPLGAVDNGTLVPARHALSPKDAEYVRSVLSHLISVYGRAHFPVLLARYEAQAKPGDSNGASVFVDVNPVIRFLQGDNPDGAPPSNAGLFHNISVKIEDSPGIPTGGYRYLYHAKFLMGRGVRHVGDLTVELRPGSDAPRITVAGKPLDGAALTALMGSIVRAGRENRHVLPASKMSAKVSLGSREWLFVATEVGGYSRDMEAPNLNLIEFDVLEK
jgi:hypothetical protein